MNCDIQFEEWFNKRFEEEDFYEWEFNRIRLAFSAGCKSGYDQATYDCTEKFFNE